ncbi:SpoVR family protein, partial [Chromobacterium subtsugae]
RYGIDEVEELLDSCHALMNYGVDRYKRPQKLSLAKEQARQEEREQYLQMQVNDLWRTIPKRDKDDSGKPAPRFPLEPQENLLYFIEKSAPLLEPWQREVVRIVRKVAQYFYPQRQTQVMNEGWATFWHYTIMNRLYDKGLITDGYMLEFLQSHTNVVTQPPVTARWYNGINPYALGFAMYQDIKRICEAPTDEDRAWFPDLAGSDWRESLEFAMRNFKDESFISQYLSPKLIRDFRFFAIRDDDKDDKLEISSIHDEEGYRDIRGKLAEQYNLGSREPNIQVWSVNVRGDRSLTLRHVMHNRRPLEDQSAQEVLKHVCRLWGFDVKLESVDGNGEVKQSYEVQAVRDPEMA